MTDFSSVNETFLRTRAALKWGPWDRDVISLSVADREIGIVSRYFAGKQA